MLIDKRRNADACTRLVDRVAGERPLRAAVAVAQKHAVLEAFVVAVGENDGLARLRAFVVERRCYCCRRGLRLLGGVVGHVTGLFAPSRLLVRRLRRAIASRSSSSATATCFGCSFASAVLLDLCVGLQSRHSPVGSASSSGTRIQSGTLTRDCCRHSRACGIHSPHTKLSKLF